MRNILEAVIGAVDTRPKNKYTTKCKPCYKKYKDMWYERVCKTHPSIV